MRSVRRTLKSIALIAGLTFAGIAGTMAQDSTKTSLDFTAGVDMYSRYLWRGAQIGTAPSLQPTLKMTYGGFTLGYWGAYQFDGASPEADLYASYALPAGFTVTVTDYFVSPSDADLGNYAEYKPDNGSLHQIEGMIGYTGPSKLPLSVTLAYTFYGAKWSDAVDSSSGKQLAMANMNGSIYAELGYTIKTLTLIVGGGNKCFSGKSDFAAVNVGARVVKNIEVTPKFTLPVTAQLMINPNTKKTMFTVGLTF